MMENVRSVAKAVAAACTGFAGSLATAYSDGNVDGVEWALIAATTVGAFAVTWSIPNRGGEETQPP